MVDVTKRRNGVFINSDLVNEYQYTECRLERFTIIITQIRPMIVTIPITDDTIATTISR